MRLLSHSKFLPINRGEDLLRYLDVLHKLFKYDIVGILPPLEVSISGGTVHLCVQGSNDPIQCKFAQNSSTLQLLFAFLQSEEQFDVQWTAFVSLVTQIGIARHKTFTGFAR